MEFKYNKGPSLCSGDICDVALGTAGPDQTQVIIKSTRDIRDQDLMLQEYRTLRLLKRVLNKTYAQCVPEAFHTHFSADKQQCINVIESFPGFISAEDIHTLDPVLEPQTVIWMWKRILGLLGWLHSMGWIHGAILPPHVLFFPDNNMRSARDERKHSVRLIDWCYAVEHGNTSKLAAWVPRYNDFYPVEVAPGSSARVGPWTDIYMSAQLIVYLLGDRDKATSSGKDVLPVKIRSLLERCLEPQPSKRDLQAGYIFESLKNAAVTAYGPPKFHRFILPL